MDHNLKKLLSVDMLRNISKFQSNITMKWFVSTVHFSDILMVIKDPHFKSCEIIYAIDFSLSLEMKSLDILAQVY